MKSISKILKKIFTKNFTQKHSDSFWKTPLNRAMFGFEAMVDFAPNHFLTFEYIQNFLKQEAASLKLYTRTFTTLLVMNSLTLFYLRGIELNLSVIGINFQKIPASAEVICLFLGLNIFGFSIQSLDLTLFSRMRYIVIHKITRSDLTNMMLADLKPGGMWVDLLTPKFIGYSSGKMEMFVTRIFFYIMSMFSFAIFAASGASMWYIYTFIMKDNTSVYSAILSTAGLVMGCVGFLVFICTQYLPFKFTCPLPIAEDAMALQKLEPTPLTSPTPTNKP